MGIQQKIGMPKKFHVTRSVCLASLKFSSCLISLQNQLRLGDIAVTETHHGVKPN